MNTKLKYGALAFCVLLSVGLFFLFQKSPATIQHSAPDEGFSKVHYNTLKTDSFIALSRKAYENFIQIEKKPKELTCKLSNLNAATKDYFNGKDALLKYQLRDHGFAIVYNNNANSLSATYKISKDGSVNVPNDVLLPMLARTNQLKSPTTKLSNPK